MRNQLIDVVLSRLSYDPGSVAGGLSDSRWSLTLTHLRHAGDVNGDPEGLDAFGRARKVIWMDGLDVWEMLDR